MSDKSRDPLLNIHHFCKKHFSEIGGICDQIFCDDEQMKCIKCISDNDGCIRGKKHGFVTIKEYFDKFFNDYNNYKLDFNYSKYINLGESYCRSSEHLISTFCSKRDNIKKSFQDNFEDMVNFIQQLREDFNEYYDKFMNEKFVLLKQSILNLKKILNYEALDGFNSEILKMKMSKMPLENLNLTLQKMKETLDNISYSRYIDDTKLIEELIKLNDGEIISYIQNDIDIIKENIFKSFNLYKNQVENNLFKLEDNIITPLEDLKKIYDSTIDYSSNSNFLEKHFTLFTDIISNNTYLAYPSSKNNIRIEDFTSFIENENEIMMKSSNQNLYLDTNVNSRDNLLCLKLEGHIAKILDIKYYLDRNNNQFLISSSEDHTIKIWNITDLSSYIKNKKNHYENKKNLNLVGHSTIIRNFQIFYHQNTDSDVIISISKNEKIKVWGFETGKVIKEIYDRNSQLKGTYEDNFICVRLEDINYLITINNSNYNIKIWDFDKGIVLNVIPYKYNSNIIQILYYQSQNKFIFIDDISTCSALTITKDDPLLLLDMGLSRHNSTRVGAYFWDENIMLIYHKNGVIHEYNFALTKFIGKLRVSTYPISYLEQYYDNKNSKYLLICHSEDQHIRIYG